MVFILWFEWWMVEVGIKGFCFGFNLLKGGKGNGLGSGRLCIIWICC